MTGVWQIPDLLKLHLNFFGMMTEKAIFAVLSDLSCQKRIGGFAL